METRPNEMAPFHIALGMSHLREFDPSHWGNGHHTAGSVRSRCYRAPPTGRSTWSDTPARMGPMPRKTAARDRSARAFTVAFPTPLPAERRGDARWMEAAGRELRLSNLDNVFWPEEGSTKGDLVAYYFNVAEWSLPYLRDRPLTMKRMPNGITGSFFYEKSAPSHTPDWMRRCPVESDDERGRSKLIDYLMVEDTAGLLFMANLGCIEFHPLHSRC